MLQKRLFIFLLYLVSYPSLAQIKTIYVATNGNDVHIGDLTHPFKTINKARIFARNFSPSGNVDIVVKGGTYFLDQTLMLSAIDGGKNGFKVKYQTYKNQKVVVSGGRKISSDWVPDKNGIWKVNLSSININNVLFRQLWVDGIKAQRSHSGIEITYEPIDYTTPIKFNQNTENAKLISNATNKSDIEIWTHWQWMANIVKVKSITGDQIEYKAETPYFVGFPRSSSKPQAIFDLQNAYEFINEPGEWYYNYRNKTLFYYPLAGKNPNTSEIIFPVLEKIIAATNVSNVEFNGLTFSHASWLYPNDYGYIAGQGSIYVQYVTNLGNIKHTMASANIEFNGCSNLVIKNNTFSHLGAEAVCFQNAIVNNIDLPSFNNIIDNNNFTDVAGTAIRIGHAFDHAFTSPCHDNIIAYNVISNAANEYRSHCGIWLGFVNKNTVINNTLSDLPYTGISTGYPNGEGRAIRLGLNIIDNNNISNVVNKLRDGGGIYNHGANNSGRSYITNNKIYNIPQLPPNTGNDNGGIYLDEGSSNFFVEKNQVDLKRDQIFCNPPQICSTNNNIIGKND